MKYLVVLADGMGDYPIAELGGVTPMQKAYKPNMDRMARCGVVGRAQTVPPELKPGSDVANLAAMGYDPLKYYTGRSPLEAANIGVPLGADDTALRCNLVTLSEDEPYESKTIIDYGADEISTEEADVLIKALAAEFETETMKLYTGTMYRHCLQLIGFTGDLGRLTPPHDVTGSVIGEYLPEDDMLRDLMKRSFDILNNHPVNLARAAAGKRKANSAWFWGAGLKPALKSFEEVNGLKGAVISAVDLIKGIGVLADMDVIEVEGATAWVDTNYEGKAAAAVEAFRNGAEFVYVHVEAPDECGHRSRADLKTKSIEDLDARLVAPLLKGLDEMGEPYRVLVLPDHYTPVVAHTHTREAVPFLIYDSRRNEERSTVRYSEQYADASELFIRKGWTLLKLFLDEIL